MVPPFLCFSLISNFTPVDGLPISCTKQPFNLHPDRFPSTYHRAITLTHSGRVTLSTPSFHLSPIWPSPFFTHSQLYLSIFISQSTECFAAISSAASFCLVLSTVHPPHSANYPRIKIYADSLMNPPLNAAWAYR